MAKKREKRKINKQGKEVKPSKSQEIRYRKRLLRIVNKIIRIVNRRLIPVTRRLEPEYIADSKASARKELISILNSLNKTTQQTDKNALKWSESFVKGTNKANEISNFNMFKRVSGIDLSRIVMNEGIEKELKNDIDLNVKLIKSIPDVYFKRINKIFEESLLKGRSADSLIKQITELGHSTTKRAKFIARDQTATISGKLNERRSANLGSVGYKWITSRDRRVRGPGGIYPNAEFNHRVRDGKYYLWSASSKRIKAPNGKAFNQPPGDGSPGIPIACRCTAAPVIPVG